MEDSITKQNYYNEKQVLCECHIWRHFAGCEHVSDPYLLSSCRAMDVHAYACALCFKIRKKCILAIAVLYS